MIHVKLVSDFRRVGLNPEYLLLLDPNVTM